MLPLSSGTSFLSFQSAVLTSFILHGFLAACPQDALPASMLAPSPSAAAALLSGLVADGAAGPPSSEALAAALEGRRAALLEREGALQAAALGLHVRLAKVAAAEQQAKAQLVRSCTQGCMRLLARGLSLTFICIQAPLHNKNAGVPASVPCQARAASTLQQAAAEAQEVSRREAELRASGEALAEERSQLLALAGQLQVGGGRSSGSWHAEAARRALQAW